MIDRPRHATLIINPISGTRSKHGIADIVISRLSRDGWVVTPVYTSGPGDATEIAAGAAADGAHAVIAAGGDGTVNEIATALCDTGTALGIIPCGSGNGLARHLNIPTDTHDAIEALAGGRILRADYATVNNRRFFCTFGVGFDAEVSERFAGKNRRGLMTYMLSTLETYRRYCPDVYTIETDGRTLTREALLVAVCNASQYGNNAFIAPGASVVDGLLDVIILHSGSPLSEMRMGLDMMAGTLGKNTTVDMIQTQSLTITRSTSGAAHIDGEPVPDFGTSFSIRCHPGALNVIVPETIRPFKPLLTPLNSLLQDLRYTFINIFGNR